MKSITNTENIGKAMIDLTVNSRQKKILSGSDINEVATNN